MHPESPKMFETLHQVFDCEQCEAISFQFNCDLYCCLKINTFVVYKAMKLYFYIKQYLYDTKITIKRSSQGSKRESVEIEYRFEKASIG
jgi:hypothetical protein